jgi:hypothetical protein
MICRNKFCNSFLSKRQSTTTTTSLLSLVTPLRFQSGSTNSSSNSEQKQTVLDQEQQSTTDSENIASNTGKKQKRNSNNSSSSPSSNNNNTNPESKNNNNTNSNTTLSFQIPAGLEVYAGCIFVVAGWWYWNEASFRRVDRVCEGIETQAREKAKQLNSVVNSTDTRWREDVRGKEAMLAKVQFENVRLAKLLDDVTNYLKKCTPSQL